MDCSTIDRAYEPKRSFFERLLANLVTAMIYAGRSPIRIDPEYLSDHMKRDLGFLDGREPHYDLDIPR